MSVITRATAITAVSLLMLGAGASPSMAKQTVVQDGLVNVVVGDITIEDAVDLNVAASVAATLCDLVDVGSVVILATEVDTTNKKQTVCNTDAGAVRITNN